MTRLLAAPRSLSLTPRRVSSEAAWALAAFYGAGGLLCLVSLWVPAWAGRHEAIVLEVGVLATTVAVVLPLTRGWLTRRICYVLVLIGSMLIASLMYAGSGGGASASYAGFYVWVAVYSFLFFSARGATVQVLVAVASELVALFAIGEGSVAPAQLLLSAGTIAATGVVVGMLAARMRTLTLTDELTGLPNRRALDVTLHDRLDRNRGGQPVAVLGIDLDGFKALNDNLGHAAGDELLKDVAKLWPPELRHGDLLARNGGDEFIVVLDDCDDERARTIATRLIAVIPPPVSACVGVAIVPGGRQAEAVDIAKVLERVDAALYAGKSHGRGSVVTAPPALAVSIPRARPA